MRVFLLLMFSVSLWSCASTTQKIDLNPVLLVSEGLLAERMAVQVRVNDSRPPDSFAKQGSGVLQDDSVSTRQGVAAVVRERIIEGLRKQGFTAVAENRIAGRALTIEIERFDFSRPEGGVSNIVQMVGAFNARVDNKETWFEKHFQMQREEKTFLLANESENDALVNEVLSDLLNRILADEHLLSALQQ